MTTGYCVRCKTRREMKDIEVKKIRAYMAFGKCPECGTKMSVSLKTEDALELIKNQAS